MRQTDVEVISVSSLAKIASDLYTSSPWVMRNMMRYRIFICPFERLVPLVPSGSSVLDIGSGAGLFLALLAGTVSEISATGFDSSDPAIKTAKKMAERVQALKKGARLDFYRLDVAAAWPTGHFNVVCLIDVMHHVPILYQKAIFGRAAEVLEPGGLLIYKDMANRPFLHAMMNRFHDLILARQWIHYLPIREVDAWAAEFRLSPVHAETTSRFWYRHDIRVFRKVSVGAEIG